MEHEEDGHEDESDAEDDGEDEDEVVLSSHFDGPTDAAGRSHGRGTLTVDFQRGQRRGRNVFTGSFSHGVKSAHCTIDRIARNLPLSATVSC